MLGAVFVLGGIGMAVSNVSDNFPNLTKLVTAWVRASLPSADFPFSSIQVNYCYAAKKHVDANNLGPSYIRALVTQRRDRSRLQALNTVPRAVYLTSSLPVQAWQAHGRRAVDCRPVHLRRHDRPDYRPCNDPRRRRRGHARCARRLGSLRWKR